MEREPVYSKEVTVKGVRYLVNHPQVEEAFEIGIELLQLVGGSAAAMAAASGDEKKAAEALGFAVNSILTKLKPREAMALVKRILRHVEVQEPKKMILDDVGLRSHFQGRTGAMLTVVGEVLGFTHADFFEAIADGVAAIMKKAAEKMGEAA